MQKNLCLRSIAQILVILTLTVAGFAQDRRLERPTDNNAVAQKKLALVIGNGLYQNVSKLDNPVNDSSDMATTLRGLGFEVISGTNANLVQMRRLIRQFGEKLEQQKGVGLFFYAGHGIEVKGKNYLVPVDAEINREIETEDATIDLDTVLRQMDAAGNGFNIVILDACRNNPFARGWNRANDSGGLANLNAPTGTYIAYAAAPGTTASDGKGTRNGVFTGALLKNLKRPNLKLEEVFKATREEVMTTTGSKQVPWDSSSIKGDFYFKRTAESATVTAGAGGKVSAEEVEEEYWASIKSSTDAADFEAYLKEYRSGKFATLARLKIAQTRKAAPDTKTPEVSKTPSGSKTILPGNIEMSFATIPSGQFEMGSINGESGENPVHTVKITRGFEMQTTEVTQEQWTAIMGANPSNFKNCPRCPVEQVSWDDAKEFIRQLNKRSDGFTYRLPTEAEWEYAARAGTTGDYAGYLDAMAWYDANSEKRTHDVATKKANDWGLFDMHGNVWEWCEDWYGSYESGTVTDPKGASSGSSRVVRGGGWFDAAAGLRSADRGGSTPSLRNFHLGFRLIRQK